MIDDKVLYKYTTLVLLFYAGLIIALWPEGAGASYTRPHRLDVGFPYTFLLAKALIAALLSGQLAKALGQPLRQMLGDMAHVSIVWTAAIPMGLLLVWSGMLPAADMVILYLSAPLCMAGVAAFSYAFERRSWRGAAVIVYGLGLTGTFFTMGFGVTALLWNFLFLTAGLVWPNRGLLAGGKRSEILG